MRAARWMTLWVACCMGCGGEAFEVAPAAEDAVKVPDALDDTERGADGAQADAGAEAEAEADAEADAEAVTDAEADAVAVADTETATDAEADAQVDADARADADAGAAADAAAEAPAACDGPLVQCFPDKDRDGYAVLGPAILACACPIGTTARSPAVVVDCHDEDVEVAPSATAFHAMPYCVPGTSCGTKSFDYDCSGVEEPKFSAVFAGCSTHATGCQGGGWQKLPDCGTTGVWITCVKELFACATTSGPFQQTCR